MERMVGSTTNHDSGTFTLPRKLVAENAGLVETGCTLKISSLGPFLVFRFVGVFRYVGVPW